MYLIAIKLHGQRPKQTCSRGVQVRIFSVCNTLQTATAFLLFGNCFGPSIAVYIAELPPSSASATTAETASQTAASSPYPSKEAQYR
jgi:hypothetical protein